MGQSSYGAFYLIITTNIPADLLFCKSLQQLCLFVCLFVFTLMEGLNTSSITGEPTMQD